MYKNYQLTANIIVFSLRITQNVMSQKVVMSETS